jgi:ferredoxin
LDFQVSNSGLRVEIDRAACRGSAVCVRRAPASFAVDAERRAVATEPPGDPDEALRTAELHCPNFAIRLVQSPD